MTSITKTEILKIRGNEREDIEDSVIVERPINLYVNNQYYTTLMCTPHELKELFVGFLFSEGVICKKDQVIGVEQVSEDMVFAYLDSEVLIRGDGQRALTSGCGRGSVDISLLNENKLKISQCDMVFSFAHILKFMKEFSGMSELFRETGGVHSCGICGNNGIEVICEDIGRHNAIDKALGKCLLNDVDMGDKMLFTTGRISSDMLIKTSKAGIGLLVSRSGPTSLAVNMARNLNISVIGFVRGNRANIYSCSQRIFFEEDNAG